MFDQPAPHRRHRRPPAADIRPDTPIWCPACAEYQPAESFNKETRRFSGLATICRDALARMRQLPEQRAKTAQRNKRRWNDPEYRARSLAASRERRQVKGQDDLRRARRRLQDIVDEWKRQGCVDCGYDDVRAIDPDHVDPNEKHNNLSRMIQLCASVARIQAELAKCVPRCARCHRLATANQRPCAWRAVDRLPPSWKRRLERQDVNDLIKLMHGCADCGWAEWPRGLDWDHVRGAKIRIVSTLIANGRPWTEVLAEMAKCEVVCANCHRIRTLTRRQYTTVRRDASAWAGAETGAAARPPVSPE